MADSNGRKLTYSTRGDNRMGAAVAARMADPSITPFEALRLGGFKWSNSHPTRNDVDTDGVRLRQRKNQLCRRVRKLRKKEERGGGGGGGTDEDISVDEGGDGQVHQEDAFARRRTGNASRRGINSKQKKSSSGKSTKEKEGRKRVLEKSEWEEATESEARAVKNEDVRAQVEELYQAAARPERQGNTKKARSVTPPLPPLPDSTQVLAVGTDGLLGAQNVFLLSSSSSVGPTNNIDNATVAAASSSSATAAATYNPDTNVANRLYDWMRRNTSDFMSFLHLSESAGLVLVPGGNGPATLNFANNYRSGRATAAVESVTAEQELAQHVASNERADINEGIQLFRSTFASSFDGNQFTEDQVRAEWINLSPEERAYTDAIVRGHRPVTRMTISRDSFMMMTLILRMKVEMDVVDNGQAMRVAQNRCADLEREFGDGRLVLFLRREELDPLKAAQRMARYWTFRTSLFGTEKCYLPFTLRGALRDDIIVLSTGTLRLMDRPDEYGRRIILSTPGRNNKVGYDLNGMVRAMMYILEAMLEGEDATENGFVCIENNSETSIWNWDKVLHDAFVTLEKDILPFEWCGIHVCSCPSLLMKLIKPVALAMGDLRTRHRLVFHEGVGYTETLQDYGVEKSMLPSDVGGTGSMDANSWCQWIQARLIAGL